MAPINLVYVYWHFFITYPVQQIGVDLGSVNGGISDEILNKEALQKYKNIYTGSISKSGSHTTDSKMLTQWP